MGRILVFVLAALPGFCNDWNPRLAADYLDSRQKEWFAWAPAKASGGPCFSCHTGMTYLLARPALRRALGESRPTPYETGLVDGLRARVEKKSGKDISPAFANEPLASQAMGVESIFSALFLASQDADSGTMSTATQQAFDRMWSLQSQDWKAKGAWAWFSLNLDPWEMPESQFIGATLAALAVGTAPADYRKRPEVREDVAALSAYLAREHQAQPLHNRLYLLWASTRLPEALPENLRKAILDEVWRTQESDGGWTMKALGPWTEHSAAPSSSGSNAYATGFVAFVLGNAGIDRTDARLVRARQWLKSRQNREFGYWTADSMNKVFKPDSMMVKFMQDAATSFAALALIEAGDAVAGAKFSIERIQARPPLRVRSAPPMPFR
jgi:squalene-hopene/tetraprenyl-beta-curcumene cyclase